MFLSESELQHWSRSITIGTTAPCDVREQLLKFFNKYASSDALNDDADSLDSRSLAAFAIYAASPPGWPKEFHKTLEGREREVISGVKDCAPSMRSDLGAAVMLDLFCEDNRMVSHEDLWPYLAAASDDGHTSRALRLMDDEQRTHALEVLSDPAAEQYGLQDGRSTSQGYLTVQALAVGLATLPKRRFGVEGYIDRRDMASRMIHAMGVARVAEVLGDEDSSILVDFSRGNLCVHDNKQTAQIGRWIDRLDRVRMGYADGRARSNYRMIDEYKTTIDQNYRLVSVMEYRARTTIIARRLGLTAIDYDTGWRQAGKETFLLDRFKKITDRIISGRFESEWHELVAYPLRDGFDMSCLSRMGSRAAEYCEAVWRERPYKPAEMTQAWPSATIKPRIRGHILDQLDRSHSGERIKPRESIDRADEVDEVRQTIETWGKEGFEYLERLPYKAQLYLEFVLSGQKLRQYVETKNNDIPVGHKAMTVEYIHGIHNDTLAMVRALKNDPKINFAGTYHDRHIELKSCFHDLDLEGQDALLRQVATGSEINIIRQWLAGKQPAEIARCLELDTARVTRLLHTQRSKLAELVI